MQKPWRHKAVKYVLITLLTLLMWVMVNDRIDQAHSEGFKLGMHYALKKDPPSEELELACAGLWVGQQNRRWFEKNK